MKLFFINDGEDDSMHILAHDFAHAITAWRKGVVHRHGPEFANGDPESITLLADDSDGGLLIADATPLEGTSLSIRTRNELAKFGIITAEGLDWFLRTPSNTKHFPATIVNEIRAFRVSRGEDFIRMPQ
jgi:hypothetical protein